MEVMDDDECGDGAVRVRSGEGGEQQLDGELLYFADDERSWRFAVHLFSARTPCWTSLISLRNDTTLNTDFNFSSVGLALTASRDSFHIYNSMSPQILGLPSFSLDVSFMYSIQRASCNFGFIPAKSFVLSYTFAGGTSLLYYSPMKNLAEFRRQNCTGSFQQGKKIWIALPSINIFQYNGIHLRGIISGVGLAAAFG